VAATAGVSPAQVQHYFRSKDELVAAAFEHVGEGVEQRAREVDRSGLREVLRRLLHLWLPLDEARTRAARVWLAFTSAAATSIVLQSMNAATDRGRRADFAGLRTEVVVRGNLATSVDVDVEAALLLAVVDGLVVQSLVLPEAQRADLLIAAIDTHLSRTLYGPDHGRTAMITDREVTSRSSPR
jgi:AcrR family transcriptional regulator